MRHASFMVTELHIGADEVVLRRGNLMVVRNDGATELDWELMVTTIDPEPIVAGAHHVTMRTADGPIFDGDAIHVRSIDGTHVFRGAGPIAGFELDDLD